jgi:uncharacterized protein GlcG (DUF336 family)
MSITLEQARRLLDRAVEHAAAMEAPSSVAVVDAGGHVVVKARMDGAPLVTVRMCEDKAYTAVAVGEPTADLLPDAQPGAPLFGLFAAEAGRMIVFGGGFPLFAEDRLVGGLGIAGGTVEQDLEIGEIALTEWAALQGGDRHPHESQEDE